MHVAKPDVLLGNLRKDRPEIPKANNLQSPLLHVLAEASYYRPRVFFPTAIRKGHHDALRDDVLRAAGYDPGGNTRLIQPGLLAEATLDDLPLPLHGSANPQGLYRKIQHAAYQKSTTYPRKRSALPLFIMDKNTKCWGLTEAGVAAAAQVRPDFARYDGIQVEMSDSTLLTVRRMVRNVTQIWLGGQLSNGLYETVLKHLLYEPQLSREKTSGEITDHLHQFFSDAIRRDSFHRWLTRGDAPTVRQLCLWATRKGISAMRKYAKDALQRTTRGALTARERAEGQCSKDAMIASEYEVVIEGDEEGRPETGERVIKDNRGTDQQLHDIARDQGLMRVRQAIRLHKPGAPDRYERVFGLMCAGESVAAIGKKEGVSRNRAASLMADTRTAIRDAAKSSIDARSLLQYVEAEGFPTREDMIRAIVMPDDEDREHPLNVRLDGKGTKESLARKRIGWLLKELVKRNRIEMHFNRREIIPDTTRKRWVPCDAADEGAMEFFSITTMGEAFLAEWNLQPELVGDYGHRVSL